MAEQQPVGADDREVAADQGHQLAGHRLQRRLHHRGVHRGQPAGVDPALRRRDALPQVGVVEQVEDLGVVAAAEVVEHAGRRAEVRQAPARGEHQHVVADVEREHRVRHDHRPPDPRRRACAAGASRRGRDRGRGPRSARRGTAAAARSAARWRSRPACAGRRRAGCRSGCRSAARAASGRPPGRRAGRAPGCVVSGGSRSIAAYVRPWRTRELRVLDVRLRHQADLEAQLLVVRVEVVCPARPRWPCVAGLRPVSAPSSVDLPAPDGPITAVRLDGPSSNDIPSSSRLPSRVIVVRFSANRVRSARVAREARLAPVQVKVWLPMMTSSPGVSGVPPDEPAAVDEGAVEAVEVREVRRRAASARVACWRRDQRVVEDDVAGAGAAEGERAVRRTVGRDDGVAVGEVAGRRLREPRVALRAGPGAARVAGSTYACWGGGPLGRTGPGPPGPPRPGRVRRRCRRASR